ncbi:hypothetical protein GCM10010191_50430 [Actinomadura vinacea]|uniref:HTH merR-type domain-containing protein n=1 Tax=Actinomadura vinacea TaxID=115336 RepID=A0ABP5WS41_9ACTN
MLKPQVTKGGAVAGEQEQVIAFVRGQPQAAGDGRDHLLRRLRPVAAFQPGELVGGHGAKLRHLLAAQARSAPTLPALHPDVLRSQRRTPGAQEGTQGRADDDLPNLTGRTVVITGAGRGLGLITARELARAGARVVLGVRETGTARRAVDGPVAFDSRPSSPLPSSRPGHRPGWNRRRRPLRSSELAALAGVTVRTLRHYHQIGILDEPDRSVNGYRDYDVRHLARLLRITRLTELGLPLAALPDVLDDPQAAETLLDELDRQAAAEIERLTSRRADIARLRRHGGMPDLPPEMAAYGPTLSAVADIAPDMACHEREQVALISHLIGETGTSAFADALAQHAIFTPATTELIRRFAELGPDTPQEAIEQLADDMVTHYRPLLENWPDIGFGTDVSSMLAAYGEHNLNDQQHRANQMFADRLINRMASRNVPEHAPACPAEPA